MLENQTTLINVCLACDNNYVQHAGVVIASILANANKNDNLVFYILDDEISKENKDKFLELNSIKECVINFVSIDKNIFKDFQKVQTHSYLSLTAYFRLKLASLLPNASKVIYFDCDFVINTSLKELYNKDLGKYPVAGVRDINRRMLKKNPNYVNSGMLVMNLDAIREQNIEEQFFSWTKANINNIKLGDQEIINEVLKDNILLVEDEWNVQSSNFTNRSSYTNNPKAIHYVAKNKPWGGKSYSYHKNLYFKYLQLTPWKISDELLKKQLRTTALEYFRYRPLFFFRPRFYKALFLTYIYKLFTLREDSSSKRYYLFSKFEVMNIKKHAKARKFMNILGLKFVIRYNRLSKKEITKRNLDYEKFLNNKKYPKIKNRFDTLKELIYSNKSISRFGDGEFNLIMGEDLPFQIYSKELAEKMKNILLSNDLNIMVAIPDTFASLEQYSKKEADFWRKYFAYHRNEIYTFLDFNKQYFDTEVSRPYIGIENKSICEDYFRNMKFIWQNKDIIFVEGEASRLGYNNDLFSGAKSIRRILCPAKNAFDRYDEILAKCKEESKNILFIIALGPTATLLAYDLAKCGYRALDFGHIDIEYEWFLRKAKNKIAIPNKYVNEAKKGRSIIPLKDKKYHKEIICDFSDSNVESKAPLTIVIFNTACFGDVLLCNSLCQNIKNLYPNSKIIFVVDKNLVDVAKYQKDVDEVVVYDKNGINKGVLGMLKFVKAFPYKKPDMSFVIYRNERNIFVSKLLGTKHILYRSKKCTTTVQQEHANLLSKVTTKKIKNYPIKFKITDEISPNLLKYIASNQNYIALCMVSKDKIKDCPLETCIELINKINAQKINGKIYRVVFCGVGDATKEYAENLKQANCNFIDLTNKTTILELASLLKKCKALVSVDTGTMHLGYALDTPTVCLFYKDGNADYWAPDPKLYKTRVINKNVSVKGIINNLKEILRESVNE